MKASARPTLRAAALLFFCFAVLATGMVELSIAAGYLLGPVSGTGTSVAAGAAALVAGIGCLGWSLTGLHRGSIPYPRATVPALAATAAVHAAAVVGGLFKATPIVDAGQLAALALCLMGLGSAGWLGRQPFINDGGRNSQPRTGRLLAAAFAAAVVVSSVATPGLAASFAGQRAVPHGGHTQPPPAVDPTSGNSGRHHH